LGGCGPVVVRAGSHLGGDPDVRTGSDPAGRPPWARLGHRQRPRGSFGVRAPCRVPRRAPQPRHGERRRLSESAATRPPTAAPWRRVRAARPPPNKPLRTPASRPWASLSRPRRSDLIATPRRGRGACGDGSQPPRLARGGNPSWLRGVVAGIFGWRARPAWPSTTQEGETGFDFGG
jgi:hypothetical protein